VRDLYISALYRPKSMETCDSCVAGVLLYRKTKVSAIQVYCFFYVTNIIVSSHICSSNAESTTLSTISEPTGSDKRYWSNLFVIKPTRYTNITNLFCHETLHVSDSPSAHHQESIHCTLSNGICHTGL